MMFISVDLPDPDWPMAAGAQDWLVDFVAGLGPQARAKVAELLTRRHKPPENGPT